MSADFILFGLLALVSVLAALGMLISRNPVHSALFLVLNFGSVAVMYLLLNAPFLAMAQITVYAGAIMVLFVFVIMLLGVERVRQPEPRGRWQVATAAVLAVVLLAALGYVMVTGAGGLASGRAVVPNAFGTPEQLATLLFSSYLFPFEITSLLLLVGMIGVVVLTKDDSLRSRRSGHMQPSSYPGEAPGVTVAPAAADQQVPTR